MLVLTIVLVLTYYGRHQCIDRQTVLGAPLHSAQSVAGEQGELSTLGNTRYYTVVTTSEDTECPAQLLSVCPHNPWSVEFPDILVTSSPMTSPIQIMDQIRN